MNDAIPPSQEPRPIAPDARVHPYSFRRYLFRSTDGLLGADASASTSSRAARGENRAAWIIAAGILFVLIYQLRTALLPFVIAPALAYAAEPVVKQVRNLLRAPRWVAAFLAYVGYLIIFAVIGFAAARTLIPQFADLASHFPQTVHTFIERLFRGETLDVAGRTITASGTAEALRSGGKRISGGGSVDALAAVTMGFEVVMGLIVTLVLLAYFMFDGPRLLHGMLWLVPPARRTHARRLAIRLSPVVGHYLRGLVVIAAYGFALTWIATRFVLHLDHAGLFAILVGLLEMIPFLGPFVSTAMIGLLAVQQVSWWGIVGFAIFATALRVSIDQFVGPLVLGRAVRVPAPVIIFSFIAGGVLLGALGILIAVPVAAAIKVILEDTYRSRVVPRSRATPDVPTTSAPPAPG